VSLFCRKTRTTQLGHNAVRSPHLIDDKRLFTPIFEGKLAKFLREGPDRTPTDYTP
jgi:hypothetical protein